MPFWTSKDELELRLLANNTALTRKEIGEILGRTERSIDTKLFKLKIVRGYQHNWSSEDDSKLKHFVTIDKSLTKHEISNLLCRSERAVTARIHRLGIRMGVPSKWTQQENETLCAMWPNHSAIEISNTIERTPLAIKRQAHVLGLTCYGRKILTVSCGVCGKEIITTTPNRKYCKECRNDARSARRLEIRRSRPVKVRADIWPQELIDRLIALQASGKSSSIIAGILGITRNAVSGKIHRLGLGCPQTRERRLANSSLGGKATKRKRLSTARIKIAKPPKLRPSPIKKIVIHGLPDLYPLERAPIHLVQIKNGQCKFIEGDDRMCCARETLNGFSWCPHHYVRTHILDRRSVAVASVNQQPLAHSTGAEHTQSELQEMDRRGSDSLGLAESEASVR